MSVSLPEKGGRGRSRSVMADLNLVPYIDLLTCMISFLLITAVWTQLSMLKTRQHGAGGAEDGMIEAFNLVVIVNRAGFVIVEGRDGHKVVPLDGGNLDYPRLTRELGDLKRAHPDATEVQVAPEDDVAFETMVKTMDVVLTAGFPDVSMKDATAGS